MGEPHDARYHELEQLAHTMVTLVIQSSDEREATLLVLGLLIEEVSHTERLTVDEVEQRLRRRA